MEVSQCLIWSRVLVSLGAHRKRNGLWEKSANVVISLIWLCFPVKLVFPGNAALYGVEMYSRVVRNKK